MALEEIKEQALKLKELRETKEALNEQLKATNESIRDIEEHSLDALMTDMGISDVTVDGVHVKKGVVFRGGVTSHTDKDAFKYLFDSNNGGALHQQVIIDLSQNPGVQQRLDALGINYEVKYSIHHMTLSSLIKELVLNGDLSTSDFDRYSIYAQPQIKVDVTQ